jgi:predicted DNA binding CopG/RHH family protein
MLQAMQQPASTQPSPTFSSFAGLLATIASPPPDPTEDAPLWNSRDLGEDVATLSYERALRAHARYRPANRDSDRGHRLPPDGLGIDSSANASIDNDAAGAAVATDAAPALQPAFAQDRDLRSASVTIRLSKAECARLHQRAAEAGLTVSAYLRSCALEAETLRAQVKQALAELKTAAETAKPVVRARRSWFGWIGWTGWLTRRRR